MSTRRTLLPSARARAVTATAWGLAAVGSLAGCSDGGADVGTVVDADPAAISPLSGEVRLPSGVLQLRATTELTSVPTTDLVGVEDDLARDGDVRYLGVAWQLSPDGRSPGVAAPLLAESDPETSVALVSDEDRIELGPARGTEAVFAAVTPDLIDDGHLEVEYDGVVQSVELTDLGVDPGAAAALYDATAAQVAEQDCGLRRTERTGRAGQRVALDHLCGALPVAVAYAPEVGWAPEGSTWVAVRLETRLLSADVEAGAPTSYQPTAAEVSATLDGAAPVATIPSPETGDAGDTGAWLIFEPVTEPAPLEVSARYTAERVAETDGAGGASGQPETREFVVERTISLTPPATGR